MILEKHFRFDPQTGLALVNEQDVENYINRKIAHYNNVWWNKAERLNLLTEINEMFDEDVQNLDVDLTPVSSTLYSDKMNKEKMIMFFDYLYILGAITWGVFDQEGARLLGTLNGIHGAVNTAEIMTVAYNDMVSHKKDGDIRCVPIAVLIQTTLVESQCKVKFKEAFLQKKLDELDLKIQAGSFIPSSDDQILIDCLRHNRLDYNPAYAESDGAIDLLDRASVSIDNAGRTLLKNTMTLNQLIQYSEFCNVVNPEFIRVLERVFGAGNLNLRNDVAHGGFGYQNYFHAAVAGTLYNLVSMIAEDMHLR